MARSTRHRTYWFHDGDQAKGDRTLAQQLIGLALLTPYVRGKTVLDAGCAEGLIAIEMAKAGAVAVHGIEYRQQAVDVANKLRGDLPVTFECANLNTWRPKRHYDIVLLLSILHKLQDPTTVLVDMLLHCNDLAVIRLPPRGNQPTVVDERSGNHRFELARTIEVCGFVKEHEADGPLNEWVGYFRRAVNV